MNRVVPTRLSAGQLARIKAAEARRAEAVALAQPVVVNGRSLTATQRDRLIEAERLAVGGLAERKKAAALVRAVEAELRAVVEAVGIEAGIEDTLNRAARRGEAFEVDVPNEPFYHRMVVDGDVALVAPEAVKPAGKAKA
jgi:hypothetical protein